MVNYKGMGKIKKAFLLVTDTMSQFGGTSFRYAVIELCIYLGITLLITLIFRIGATSDESFYISDFVMQYTDIFFLDKNNLQLPNDGIIGAILNIQVHPEVYRFICTLPIGGAIAGVLCTFWGKGAAFWLLNKPLRWLIDEMDSISESEDRINSNRLFREQYTNPMGIVLFFVIIIFLGICMCVSVYMPVLIYIDVIVGCVQIIRNTYIYDLSDE